MANGLTFFYLPKNWMRDFLVAENKQQGFTLIELIAVVVILGILAAMALPRFVNLGQDARLASLNALEGSVRTASTLLHSACILKPNCSTTSGFFFLPYDGRTLRINNAYPEAVDVVGGDQIDTLLTQSGFDVVLVNNLTTRFDLRGAPTPANCSVSYQQAASLGAEPKITVTTGGC